MFTLLLLLGCGSDYEVNRKPEPEPEPIDTSIDSAIVDTADSSNIDTGEDTSEPLGQPIAICSVDTKNRIVKYAGANRPVWIIRNGQTQVEEIKATKTAIGGLTEDNQHFESHELKLQQGDTFYICTDGYADQFGGAEGKKLMTKKLKEMLLEIQSKTMKEQKQHLANFVENWKGNREQIDDILVIGVRI